MSAKVEIRSLQPRGGASSDELPNVLFEAYEVNMHVIDELLEGKR